MEKNGEVFSPGKTKEKLSLRKRLFIRKTTRVGCVIDPDSLENGQSSAHSSNSQGSRSSSASQEPDFRVISKSSSALDCESLGQDNNLAKSGRPQSLIEGQGQQLTYRLGLNERLLDGSLSNYQSTNAAKRPLYIPVTKHPGSSQDGTSSLQSSPSSSIHKSLLPQSSLDNLSQSQPEITNHNEFSSNGSSGGYSLDRKNRIQRQSSKICPGSGSMDSLARNSLLAGQVLRLIPVEQARERNFLHGRLATNSLLGAVELEHVFPDREVKIFVGTWNMNGQPPPRELNDFLFPNSITYVSDILSIGTQESFSERSEWEINVQEALGPSHILLHSATLGTLHLSIFIRRDLIWFCSLPEDASMSVRPGTAFRTKGAVAISFSLFGSTFLFVTAHLTAHQEKVKERVQDIKRIIRSLDLPRNLPLKHKSKDVTNNFDFVLWCGDLNFRLGEPRSAVMKWIKDTEFPLPPHMPHGLLHADQLTTVLADGAAFRDFREATITFPPTYKYDPGTQQFDTSSKQRAPAYTDRILFKSKLPPQPSNTGIPGFRRSSSCPSGNTAVQNSMHCLAYNSTPTICTSDHKPVWGLFSAGLRPGTDIVPLAAGLFNRDVYLEGIRRRAAILDPVPGTSVVCSIQ